MFPKLLPRFRTDLEVVPRIQEGGSFSYLIKDPSSGEVFELGEEDYFLCKKLDGQISFPQIRETFADHLGVSIQLHQLEAFARRLGSSGLLDSKKDAFDEYPSSAMTLKTRLLFNPDWLLGLLAAGFSWCFSFPFMALVSVLAFFSMGIVVAEAGNYLYGLALLKLTFGPSIFVLVPVFGYSLIIVLGEMAKGVACKHFTGQTSGFKVFFVYRVIPRFYVDIYDSLWFMNKSARIRVLFAGPISQFLLWAVGVISWKHTTPGTDLHTFWSLFSLSAFIFFLLNMNPLVQRDGYLLFSVWKEIRNLSERAEAVVRAWVLGRPLPEPLNSQEIRLFRWYGLLSIGFRHLFEILILGLLGYFLIDNMKGVGAVLFLTVLCLRFENFLRKMSSLVWHPKRLSMSQSGIIRFSWLFKLGLLLALIILLLIPYPFEAGGDFKLLPAKEKGIRAQVSGEIGSVFVKEGQWVAEGQILAQMTGREQRKKVEELEAAIDSARANLELLKKGATPEEIAKVRQEVRTVATSYEYSKSQAERAKKMFKDKAIPEKDYENALRFRDLDKERLELAKKNLELVESGFRDEQVTALEAQIRGMEVELRHAKEDLGRISLVSPIEGAVITPLLSEKVGQFLTAGELFAVVEDARTLIVEIELPEEELGEIRLGARVKLRSWAYPTTVFKGQVTHIAPVAFEESRGKIERAYSDREWLIEQNQTIREKGKVVRVLCELDNSDGLLKTDMTGYAKIECKWRPVGVAFTRWLIRFLFVEVWSWIP